jgi:hypothetical protein
MEILYLGEIIERLVTFGGATAPQEFHHWLVSCGVAQLAQGQIRWMVPTMSYLRSVLPARDRLDLMRKTTVRDPRYRLHLDLSIARVIQIIARGERWNRFEELVFGVISPASQRLLSLVEWVAEHSGESPNSLNEKHWNQFEQFIFRHSSPDFHSWDNHLWGYSRDAADLFPLLKDLYLPLTDQPVHFNLTEREAQVMVSLIEAAEMDDGVLFSVEDSAICEELKRAGAPILRRSGSQLCTLTGDVELSVTRVPTMLAASIHSAPLGITALAKRSRVRINAEETSWLRLSAPSGWRSEATFLSVCPVSETWQDAHVDEAPPWTFLPKGSILTESTSPKKISGVDDALISLDCHPLYGLLLQLLIAEALDRELGDETILLAPPLDHTGAEAECRTTVLYRPAAKSETSLQCKTMGYFSLGRLDLVLDQIAQHVSLQPLPLPYSKVGFGLWSWALHLLIDLKVVIGQRDRWTLNPSLHDRFYTGALMAKVLRDRREARQAIHHVLSRLWQAASSDEGESKIAKGVAV